MKNFGYAFLISLFFLSCYQPKKEDFKLAFGSCNNQNLPNSLWKEIAKNNPDVMLIEGDIVYCDTENMDVLKKCYEQQNNDSQFKKFKNKIPVIATWDDHDFGENDGGTDYSKKDESQQLFLDFFNIPKQDIRRKRKGVYFSKIYNIDSHSIKIILLDTRYFRSKLTLDSTSTKRYKPNKYGQGTMLGTTQWNWLKNELKTNRTDFTIIASSIQFLSDKHGFECWGNMPHEQDRLINLITDTQTKNVIILSGDRHIAEISKKIYPQLKFPIIDFTSSGLTHSYTNFTSEKNPYRINKVVPLKNFGILKFNFSKSQVTFEVRGIQNRLYSSYTQVY
ncbi:MAG: alkaline phosphatase D family protein [Lutibacter sp.]